MGRNSLFARFKFVFDLYFPRKSVSTNKDWTGLSDISYCSPFSRDSNDIKKCPKNGLKLLIFCPNSSE